jgi:hypothetical protein
MYRRDNIRLFQLSDLDEHAASGIGLVAMESSACEPFRAAKSREGRVPSVHAATLCLIIFA